MAHGTLKVKGLLEIARKALGPLPDNFLTRLDACLATVDLERQAIFYASTIYGRRGVLRLKADVGESEQYVHLRTLEINKDFEVLSNKLSVEVKEGFGWERDFKSD
jgi:hypothetical protein